MIYYGKTLFGSGPKLTAVHTNRSAAFNKLCSPRRPYIKTKIFWSISLCEMQVCHARYVVLFFINNIKGINDDFADKL